MTQPAINFYLYTPWFDGRSGFSSWCLVRNALHWLGASTDRKAQSKGPTGQKKKSPAAEGCGWMRMRVNVVKELDRKFPNSCDAGPKMRPALIPGRYDRHGTNEPDPKFRASLLLIWCLHHQKGKLARRMVIIPRNSMKRSIEAKLCSRSKKG